jgi:hypothetical protein
VQHRFRVRPDPGDRPEQSAEHERQQTDDADRLELRVMPLVRNLLRQDVDHPEQHDQDDRHEEQDEDRENPCDFVFDLRRHERGLGRRRPAGDKNHRQKQNAGERARALGSLM